MYQKDLSSKWGMEAIIILHVGSPLSDFFKTPKKIRRFGSDQLDACTYCPNGLKTKNQDLEKSDY